MAIDFPAFPTVGQQVTSGGITYTWDGQAWMAGSSVAWGVYDLAFSWENLTPNAETVGRFLAPRAFSIDHASSQSDGRRLDLRQYQHV